MNIGQFILRLRRRLQDSYTYAGVYISTASTDGIRWTKDELLDIINSGLEELVRLIFLYRKSPIFEYCSSRIVSPATIIIADNKATLTSQQANVLSVSDADGNDYAYIEPDKYDMFLNEEKRPNINEYFYTVMFDLTDNTHKIYTINFEAGVINITFVNVNSNFSSDDITNNTLIGLVGLTDLLADICEREARDREHNWDRSTILDSRIAIKLGLNVKEK